MHCWLCECPADETSQIAGKVRMEMTIEEQQAYDWALKQGFQSVAARYARILAKYIQRRETMSRDVTIKDLGQLGRGRILTSERTGG